ncbi:MAG: hypothetical protein KDE27_06625 [Planctomycetes bacterium]|nr:hypothetical protein [Planctomycetota bacterium]
MHDSRHLLLLAAVLVPSAVASAQADWFNPWPVPKARAVHTAAFDINRNEIVLFGGNTNAGVQGDTWVWSAVSGWRNAHPSNAPSARREHAMTYDPARGEIVLFGGWDGVHLNDTWTWNGTDWSLTAPANSPSVRMPELAWDPAGSRVLMFGGEGNNGQRFDETWTWDGATWTQLAPATVFLSWFGHPRDLHSFPNRRFFYLGWDGAFLGDTWIWNGIDWTAAPAGPTARSEHRMAFAGGRVILFGGDSAAGRLQDTWEWSGTGWTQLSPTAAPGVREEHVLVDDLAGGDAMLFGGWHSATGHLADHWKFAAGQWTELTPNWPTGTGTGAMDFDPVAGRSVLFGGYQDQQISNETWSYVAGSWTRLTPTTSPPARAEPALAFDRVRNQFVMFGGVDGSITYADTWTLTGSVWQQRTSTATPPARWGHALVFDEARGSVLLFAGRQGGTATNLADTWEWNGTQWQQLSPATVPAGREDHGLVFDRSRNAPLMFGGWIGGSGFTDQTWAFTNGNWVLQTLANQPSARAEQMMAYDRARDCVVMFGGQDGTGRVSDTWELTDDWRQRSPAHAPEPREEGVMVFDEAVDEIVMAVGWDLGHFTDTWHYGARPSATAIPYGTGCQGNTAALPVLAVTRPWLGNPVTATASALPSGAFAIAGFGVGRINLDLGVYGMPGCTALLQPLATVFLASSGTVATLTFTQPAQPALVGARMQMQVYALAPGANPTGVINTNAVELTASLK